jgi:hypothetical protein
MAITRKSHAAIFGFHQRRRPPSILLLKSNFSSILKDVDTSLDDKNVNDLVELLQRVNGVSAGYIEKLKKEYQERKMRQEISITFYRLLLELFKKDIYQQITLSCSKSNASTQVRYVSYQFNCSSDKPTDSDLERYTLHLSRANPKKMEFILEDVFAKAINVVARVSGEDSALFGKRCIVVAKAILKYTNDIEVLCLQKALISASIMNHVELVELLLKTNKVHPNTVMVRPSKGCFGLYTLHESAISMAVHHENYAVMECFSQNRFNFNSKEILKDARINEIKMLSFLLNQGIEPLELLINNKWVGLLISEVNKDPNAIGDIQHTGKLNEYSTIFTNAVKNNEKVKFFPPLLISALFHDLAKISSVAELIKALNEFPYENIEMVRSKVVKFEMDIDKIQFTEETKELRRRLYVSKALLHVYQVKDDLICKDINQPRNVKLG